MKNKFKNDLVCHFFLLMLLLLPDKLLYAQDFPEAVELTPGRFENRDAVSPSIDFIMMFSDLSSADVAEEPPFHIRTDYVDIEDPAGHSCCIEPPPDILSLSWQSWGRLTIDGDGSTRDYLPIENVIVDEGGSLSGQQRSTVAGFSNVLTTISGQFSEQGMYFVLTVGADGALPSGQPIQFVFGSTLETEFHMSDFASPLLGLEVATGSARIRDWEIDPESERNFDLFLSIDDNDSSSDADWFILQIGADGTVSSYNLVTFQFEPGLVPSYQGPLTDVAATQIIDLESLPEEGSIFAFGVDDMDGELNDDVEFTAIEVVYFN